MIRTTKLYSCMLTDRSGLVASLVLLCGSVLLAGCGPSMPATVPVSGRVTWHGQPIKEGTVAFMPAETTPSEGKPLRAAMGRIQSDGSYQLSTFGENDGAMPGKYLIAISDQGEFPTEFIPGQPQPKSSRVLPTKYAMAQSSGLTVTVSVDDGPIKADFDLPGGMKQP